MSDVRFGPNTIALDTDVASRYHMGKLDPTMTAKLFGRHKVLPFVVVGELTQWTVARSWGAAKTETLAQWLDESAVISGDEAAAKIWGRIKASAIRQGRTPPYNDSWVAASCLSFGVPLATYNTKDYQYFADHHGLILL